MDVGGCGGNGRSRFVGVAGAALRKAGAAPSDMVLWSARPGCAGRHVVFAASAIWWAGRPGAFAVERRC